MAGDERQGGGGRGRSERQVTAQQSAKENTEQTIGFGLALAPGDLRAVSMECWGEKPDCMGLVEKPDSEILLPSEP